jgi:hypothetical protein
MEDKTVANQLGIYINPSRVGLCFNEKGTNSSSTQELNEVCKLLMELKKKGAVRPEFTAVLPKKPKTEELMPQYNILYGTGNK